MSPFLDAPVTPDRDLQATYNIPLPPTRHLASSFLTNSDHILRNFALEDELAKKRRQRGANPSLTDRKDRAIAELLARFRSLVNLTTTDSKDDGSMATREVAATEGFSMEVHSAALVCCSFQVAQN
jgi:hypothetical protein